MINTNVKYPEMRREIYLSLKQFSDPEFQQSNWLDPRQAASRGEIVDFNFPFHILYDDSPGLDENPHGTIGDYLMDGTEATAIKNFFSVLTPLLERYGPLGTAEQFVGAPEWQDVVSCAKVAVETMERNI